MNEIENIKRYIERTPFRRDSDRYYMTVGEWKDLCRFAVSSRESVVDAIDLAFPIRPRQGRAPRTEGGEKT